MKEILKNKLISTQFVEKEIVIHVKYVNNGTDRTMLLENVAPKLIVSSRWLNGYLKDAKVSEEDVKKKACARKFRMGKTVYLSDTEVTFPVVLKTEDRDYIKRDVTASVFNADDIDFRYIGIDIKKVVNGIEISMDEYAESLQEIKVRED